MHPAPAPRRIPPIRRSLILLHLLIGSLLAGPLVAQQRIDEEYTRLIAEHLTDPRISTELVDHLPWSDRVPTPLEFPGIERIVGTPGELTYARDIHRYMRAIAATAPERARIIPMGKTEEGREMLVIAIASEEIIANLDTYRGYLHELTDPRATTESRARELEEIARPIYWITTGLHSGERGGPEMVMELAYRLVVDESEFIRDIRENVITFITPVLEVDGRERMVDTYYFNELQDSIWEAEEREGEAPELPLVYWGRYVAHDNNRDGMGQFLALTRNTTKIALEWKPTLMHDLHEAATLLYSSTGTGPYNENIDAITVNEWWMFAQNDVMEMTKRGVPGVWTYNFYDGWTPNYLFYAAHSHNATGRFYEVASYGPDNRTIRADQSREWYRPNPLQGEVEWGPRANTNIQQSGVLFSLHFMGQERERWLENYWIKNRNAVERGLEGPIRGWVVPASQLSKADAAEAVNDLIAQGLEFHVATEDLEVRVDLPVDRGDAARDDEDEEEEDEDEEEEEVSTFEIRKGDWIVRGDQPYRTVADIYFSLQRFPTTNPRPYDDLGWTFPLMRDIEVVAVSDPALLEAPMEPVAGRVVASGGIRGDWVSAGSRTIVVPHTGDNALVEFRFRFAETRMRAVEEAFEIDSERFPAGSFLISTSAGDISAIDQALRQLGLDGVVIDQLPASVPTHELDVPRIGYIHSWRRTQDEGWVRAALDRYGIPYTYFGENEVHRRDLRAEFDVILYPHGGNVGELADPEDPPLPYRATDRFTSFGRPDATDDVRGSLGEEGLQSLLDFVRSGGTLIAEGNTAGIFPEYDLTPGLEVADADDLIARGSVYRGILHDESSPIRYGIAGNQMPVYFKDGTILDAGLRPADAAPDELLPDLRSEDARARRRFDPGPWQNTSPMASPVWLSPWEHGTTWPQAGSVAARMAARGTAAVRDSAAVLSGMGPRVILRFPAWEPDMLLSGGLAHGQALSNRAQVVDQPVGAGHMVLFSIRPFWRWQTHGTYILGFNAILNWNDLDAGR
ncbi:MAG: M14 family zinc carboxypeptidase [Longimicrobiales bacterium]|nr:M14 family zinc carboxypeptidase [Longimicrobiales bacterium]